jgi:hypothetical protein
VAFGQDPAYAVLDGRRDDLVERGEVSVESDKLDAKPGASWWALLGVLVLVAHASLFGVGPVGEDFRTLVEASRAVHTELGGVADAGSDSFYDRAGTSGRPLAALSLGTSSWLFTSGGVWTPFAISWLRFENLVLLLLVAFGLGRFLRRLVAPWTGSEHANAASSAAFMILMVHPLSVAAVASPAARGDLLAAVLAMAAGAAFLRGRQERSYLFVALAALCTFGSTLASELGFLCPVWLAVIEYASSRRYRPKHVRLRTALTTLVVFSAFAGLDVVLRIWVGVDPWPVDLRASFATLTNFGDAMGAAFNLLTKLGVLILPVNGANAGGFGFVCGALLLVVVVQPALHAGLSAPRFWIAMVCVWLTLVLLAEAVRATLEVGPNDFSAAAGLFPAVVVMAVGISLASTAVSGSRRQGLPLIVAFLLCALARSNARGWRAAAKDAGGCQTEVSRILEAEGADRRYLLVDPPEMVDLYRATPKDLGWMFDEAITGLRPGLGGARAEQLSFRRIDSEALPAYARLTEFDREREEGLVVVFHDSLVKPGGRRRWERQVLTVPRPTGTAVEWRNPTDVGGEDGGVRSGGHWLDAQGESPFFADSGDIECITVSGASSTEPVSEAAEVYWRARNSVVRGGQLAGVWLEDGGGRHVVFDPGSSLAWLLGPRVDSLLLMGVLAEAPGAEVWSAPPSVPGLSEPEVDGDDWHFGSPLPASPAPLEPPTETEESADEEFELERLAPEESWSLTLLDLETLEYIEIPCEFDDEGLLNAPEAEEVSQTLRSRPGSLAWGVEHRLDGAVIERSGGRL